MSGPTDFLKGLEATLPEASANLTDLYKRKLWHQLTEALEALLKSPSAPKGKQLEEIYTVFIKDFETRVNQLRLAQIVVHISRAIEAPKDARDFLATFAEKIKKEKEAFAYVQIEIANSVLREGDVVESKKKLEELEELMNSASDLDNVIQSCYYYFLSQFYKMSYSPVEYYKNVLLYLAYTPATALDVLDAEGRRSLAFELALSAVIGEGVFNFGELLGHPILKELAGGPSEWLPKLLSAFNNGRIPEFERILRDDKAAIMAQAPALYEKEAQLREKISILALMEMVMHRAPNDRNITFAEVAAAAQLPENEVELMLMKAMSLKLVKGVIDELDRNVRITWVQPHVLERAQLESMKDKLQTWEGEVKKTLVFLEQETPELFV